MKVFIVTEGYYYESGSVSEVFSSYILAERFILDKGYKIDLHSFKGSDDTLDYAKIEEFEIDRNEVQK